MPYVRVGGIDLYYEAHGTGPRVVVLAHGALGSVGFAATSGLNAATLAARGLRVIAYDARGHGRSSFFTTAGDYDQQMLAGELLGLLDALDFATRERLWHLDGRDLRAAARARASRPRRPPGVAVAGAVW
jgi:non-heme chloroperoxidase